MAIRKICGCDYFFDTSHLAVPLEIQWGAFNTNQYAVAQTGGAFDEGYFKIRGANADIDAFPVFLNQLTPSCSYRYPASATSITFSGWLKMEATGSPGRTNFLVFGNGGTGSVTTLAVQGYFSFLPSTNTIAFHLSQSTGAIVASSVSNLDDGQWHFIEVAYHCANSGGTINFYVDGSIVLTFTGDTQAQSSTSQCNAVMFVNHQTTAGNYFDFSWDDLILADDTTQRGVQRIFTVTPESDITSDWTPTPAGDHFSVHTTPISETTLVRATAANLVDLYTLPDAVATVSDILAIQLTSVGNVSSGGKVKLRTVSNLVTTDTAESSVSGAVGALNSVLYMTDPGTGLAWTISGFNALQAGIVSVNTGTVNVLDFIIETTALSFDDPAPGPGDDQDTVFVRVRRGTSAPAAFRYTTIVP